MKIIHIKTFLTRTYHTCVDFIIDALFPPQCVACHTIIPRTHQFRTICDTCFSRIEKHMGFSCVECGRRLPTLSLTCHPHSFPLLVVSSFSQHEIRALIYALKFHGIRNVTIPLAHLLHTQFTQYVPDIPSSHFLCIPIPLHATRERERGFNQSALLAHVFSSYFSPPISINERIIVRTTPTPSQTTLASHAERKRNVAHAFSTPYNGSLKDRIIILVDDVVTSGATLHAAASTLRTKNARAIIGLAVARA